MTEQNKRAYLFLEELKEVFNDFSYLQIVPNGSSKRKWPDLNCATMLSLHGSVVKLKKSRQIQVIMLHKNAVALLSLI